MNPGSKKTLVVLLFIALLVGPVIYIRSHQRARGALEANEALERYGLSLEEVSVASGIDFVHTPPKVDGKLANIEPQIASMGAAVSVVDFDRDGLYDFYVTNSAPGSKNRLYRNLGGGKFIDVAEAMGVADLNQPGTGSCTGTVWGDYDNDGYDDLLVYKWGKPELFHNEQGHGFTRVTEGSGLPA